MSSTREYIVIAFTENHPGVLNRITAYYLRRKINIESLKVSESSIKGISMFVISAYTTEEIIDKLVKQLRNIVDLLEVKYYTADELITQEIALYKISTKTLKGSRVDTLAMKWGARLIEITPRYVVVEKTGARQDIEALHRELLDDGVLLEFTRSGSVVLHRESINDILNEKLDK